MRRRTSRSLAASSGMSAPAGISARSIARVARMELMPRQDSAAAIPWLHPLAAVVWMRVFRKGL